MFGEIAVFCNCNRTVDVKAKTFCIIDILHKKDFMKACQNSPGM